jgi:hypothetical protein
MEKRMKTVSKSIDLAVTSRLVVPELSSSVADPEGTETFGRIRSGTEINVSDPDSNPDPQHWVLLFLWSNILAARQEHCS